MPVDIDGGASRALLRRCQEGILQRHPEETSFCAPLRNWGAPAGKLGALAEVRLWHHGSRAPLGGYAPSIRGSHGLQTRDGQSMLRWSSARGLMIVVHGDEFTTVGARPDLLWSEKDLSKHVEIKIRGHLGEAADSDRELLVLNRVARLTPEGLCYESDLRNAGLLIRSLCDNAHSAATPGDKSLDVTPDATLKYECEMLNLDIDDNGNDDDCATDPAYVIMTVHVGATTFSDDITTHCVYTY